MSPVSPPPPDSYFDDRKKGKKNSEMFLTDSQNVDFNGTSRICTILVSSENGINTH